MGSETWPGKGHPTWAPPPWRLAIVQVPTRWCFELERAEFGTGLVGRLSESTRETSVGWVRAVRKVVRGDSPEAVVVACLNGTPCARMVDETLASVERQLGRVAA